MTTVVKNMADINKKSESELLAQLRLIEVELSRTRVNIVSNESKNVREIRSLRRSRARIYTQLSLLRAL